MNHLNFPIEFNDEVNDIKQSDNEFYTYASNRISDLAEEHDDISGAVVNLKQPSKRREIPTLYEVTIVIYMGSDHNIIATEKDQEIQTTLNGALDIVERQLREHRKQTRSC